MHLKLTVVLLVAIVYSVSAIVCPQNYCETVDCSNSMQRSVCEQNQNGIYEEHGTFCGCCPACLSKLNIGDNCFSTLLRGMPPRAKCVAGSHCDPNTRTCVAIQ